MMEYFVRHKKVLIFGLILAGIFLVLTGLSARQGGESPIKLTEFITRERTEEQAATSTFPTPTTTTPTPTPTTPAPTTPPAFPDIVVAFVVGSGWTPGSTNGHVGQKVIWRNDTEENIQLMELFPKKSAIANGVTLAPAQTAEILLTDTGLFTYRELNSGFTGRIFVLQE